MLGRTSGQFTRAISRIFPVVSLFPDRRPQRRVRRRCLRHHALFANPPFRVCERSLQCQGAWRAPAFRDRSRPRNLSAILALLTTASPAGMSALRVLRWSVEETGSRFEETWVQVCLDRLGHRIPISFFPRSTLDFSRGTGGHIGDVEEASRFRTRPAWNGSMRGAAAVTAMTVSHPRRVQPHDAHRFPARPPQRRVPA
jgi:hypothetical protein